MPQMSVKNFIETVFVHQVGELVQTHPYLAFIVMASGIELLGKCLRANSFEEKGVSRNRFEEAIQNLQAFTPYRGLVGKNNQTDLYASFRCGLAHVMVPNSRITLSSKNEMKHLQVHGNGKRVNLRCEDFYEDFKKACAELFNMSGDIQRKLSQPFLSVPETIYDEDPPSLLRVTNPGTSIDASGTNFFPEV